MTKFICFEASENSGRITVATDSIKSFGVFSNYDMFVFLLRYGDRDHEVLELNCETEEEADSYYVRVLTVIGDPALLLEVSIPHP